MDIILLAKAIVMGLVEGITEFLPISSTGHLIIAGELLHFLQGEPRALFEIVIQLGAILAVCWLYREKIIQVLAGLFSANAPHRLTSWRFSANIFIAFLPAALVGIATIKLIQYYLFNPVSVAIAFLVGALIILIVEKYPKKPVVEDVDSIDWKKALYIGLAQCFSLIPGTSRSGATIIGGLLSGLNRKTAAEFSFFLAIPVMFAACLYDLYKYPGAYDSGLVSYLAVGFLFSFIGGLFAVKAFIGFISNHSFRGFAYYRIAFAVVLLLANYYGLVH